MKYRILWKRKGEDKACGWGEPIFDSYKAAHGVAEDANRKYPGLFHWAEREACAKIVTEVAGSSLVGFAIRQQIRARSNASSAPQVD